MLDVAYAPNPDGRPDPGEVVWTWVPYEDDPTQGKDRPVLLVGRWHDGTTSGLWGLYLTSKDHDRDAAQEARAGRFWMDIGTGSWDREGRPSEVRLNRIVAVDPAQVRREGAAVPRGVFEAVVQAAKPYLTQAQRISGDS
ncbi:type II toxin-antitoxin system PemK/MazF family toxin [Nocardioides sp.]|uniref:type II toxin-antitoxin system PemK/MazF family toxin n=1 Tax=Nocardioides sp. TaxID=35761 RepID=UPI00261DD43A|nr:type II toxin-antitoxin system PemK/MazF family toxin [Nocardioides sp.]